MSCTEGRAHAIFRSHPGERACGRGRAWLFRTTARRGSGSRWRRAGPRRAHQCVSRGARSSNAHGLRHAHRCSEMDVRRHGRAQLFRPHLARRALADAAHVRRGLPGLRHVDRRGPRSRLHDDGRRAEWVDQQPRALRRPREPAVPRDRRRSRVHDRIDVWLVLDRGLRRRRRRRPRRSRRSGGHDRERSVALRHARAGGAPSRFRLSRELVRAESGPGRRGR